LLYQLLQWWAIGIWLGWVRSYQIFFLPLCLGYKRQGACNAPLLVRWQTQPALVQKSGTVEMLL